MADNVVLLGAGPNPDLVTQANAGLVPLPEYLAIAREMKARIMSFTTTADERGRLANWLLAKDKSLGASIAALARSRDVASIYVTGEDIGLRLLLLMRLLQRRGRIILVVHACTTEKRCRLFRLIGHANIQAIIVVSQEQRRILIEKAGMPADKVHFFYNWVDKDFFDPAQAGGEPSFDYVFSCGKENRDYGTLLEAARLVPHRVTLQNTGFFAGTGWSPEGQADTMEILTSRVPWPDLRALYHNARFVVVPINAVSYAAGVTGMLEAMSMGKAVIVSDSPGIRGYLEPEGLGVFVPTNDPAALAAAIDRLWQQPDLCREMGRLNRAWVERHATVQGYAEKVARLAAAA